MFNSTKIVFQRNGCVNIYHFPLKFEKRGNASHSSVKYSLESGLPYFKFCQSLSDYITQTSDLKLLIGVNLSGGKKSFFKGKKTPVQTWFCVVQCFFKIFIFLRTPKTKCIDFGLYVQSTVLNMDSLPCSMLI